jgi:hypothetical protein
MVSLLSLTRLVPRLLVNEQEAIEQFVDGSLRPLQAIAIRAGASREDA